MRRHVKAAMKSVEASDLHSLIFTNVGIYPVLEDVFGFKVLSQFYWSDELVWLFLRVNSQQTAQGTGVSQQT